LRVCKSRRHPNVVIVEKRNILAVGGADSGVARRRRTPITLPAYQMESPVSGKRGWFGTSVVDDDAFEVPDSLREN
jgi:hypothetical protein